MPEVSVIMSVHNEETFLHYAIDSILNQTFLEFEFIIIDDGSTDNTWNILTQYKEKDTRIILIRHKERLGVARSLNEGIKLAQGKFLARQDADDISLPERLSKQVAFLHENPEVGLLGTKRQIIDEHNVLVREKNYFVIENNEDIRKRLLDHNCITHGSAIIRRQLIDIVGYYDESLNTSQDYDLWLRLIEVTELANLPEPLYLYRQHPNSVSSKKRKQQLINHAKILERAIFRQFGPNPSSDALFHIAKEYLKASLVCFATYDLNGARDCLDRALSFDSLVIQTDNSFEKQLLSIVPTDSLDAKLKFIESIFINLLPKNRYLSKLKTRIISRYHMAEVFSGVRHGKSERIEKHLWLGIRNDFSWLFNRGVISLIIRYLIRQGNRYLHSLGLV